MRRSIALLAAMAATAAIAAGCGNGAPAKPRAADTTATAGGGGGNPSAAATRGGTLTVGTTQGIPQLNPAVYTFAWEESLFPLLWDGLTKWTPSGTVAPDAAKKWTASPDQRTWTFQLRDGVKFSNGKPVTAQTVVQTFHYYLAKKTASQERTKIATITDVRALGDHAVRFRLSDPNVAFPAAVANVKLLDIASLGQIDHHPAVTGPYRVTDFVPDDHVTLERNPDYFGSPPPLDKIKITKVGDPTAAVTSLRSGDLNVLWNVPVADSQSLASGGEASIVRAKVPSQFFVWELDTTSKPFSDVRARQALSYAIDRKQVLDAAFFGQGQVAPTNDPLASSNPAYGGALTQYPFDLQKAKQLFDAAGVHAGDTLTWWGVADAFPEWKTVGELLQANLKKIGITLKIHNSESSAWTTKFYPAGKSYPGVIVPNLISLPPDPALALSFFRKGVCECNWDNSSFLSAYQKALGVSDEGAGKAAWGDVQTIISREVPLVVPLQTTVVTGVRKGVGGVWEEGGGQLHLESAYLEG